MRRESEAPAEPLKRVQRSVRLGRSLALPNQGTALAIISKTRNRGRDQWQHDFIRQRQRCRAKALPKVLIHFQGAHPFREVSILEKPENSSKVLNVFQGAHPK
jgi:hypothetical protein